MQRIAALAILFMITAWSGAAQGQTVLSGDISKYLLNASNNPFIVMADIEIPKNKHVVIGEGCLFLFEEFTGLSVYGSMQVEGTERKPVIFTSIKDTAAVSKQGFSAAPFDWNGIFIQPFSDSATMRHFIVQYSVYGLKSLSKKVLIDHGTFRSNGQYHCFINDRQQKIEDNVPFSFPAGKVFEDAVTPAVQPMVSSGTVSASKSGKRHILLTSFPSHAEVYYNKQPGMRVWKNSVTPVSIRADKGSGVMVTLFRPGYDNTTYQIDFARAESTVHVPLLPLPPDKVSAQHRFLNERLQSRFGFGMLIATPVFIGAGAYAAYAAYDQRKIADDAADFLSKTLLPKSDPEYQRQQESYNDAKGKTDIGRKGAIAALSTGIVLLGFGVTLYW